MSTLVRLLLGEGVFVFVLVALRCGKKRSSCFSAVVGLRYGEDGCCLQLSRRERKVCCYRVLPASWNNESVFFFSSLWLPRKSDCQHASVSFLRSTAHSRSQIKSLPFHSTLPVQVIAV